MNKKLLIVGIAILLLVVGLSGCVEELSEKTDSELIIGSWETAEGEKWTFTSDGTIYKGNDKKYYITEERASEGGVRTGILFIRNRKSDLEGIGLGGEDFCTYTFDEDDILSLNCCYFDYTGSVEDIQSWVLYRET